MAFLIYQLYRVIRAFFAALPIGLDFRIGQALGMAAYYLAAPYRKLVARNLAIAFPEKSSREIGALARKHFSTLGANLLCSLKTPAMSAEAVKLHATVENVEVLEEALARGKGVVMVISHIGNWELFAQLSVRYPHWKTSTVYQSLGNRYIDADIKRDRGRYGLIPFDRKEGFGAPIKFLREGGLVGVLVDQHAGDGGVWTPLFNRLASTSPLAAMLATRTGAELVPVAIYTEGIAKWRAVVGESIPAGTLEPEPLTAEINRVLENQIRVSPADWFWVHDRWKTPSPNFLLARYKRGVCFPAGFDHGTLAPFRILIRATNWLGDAVISAPAVEAIKRGRPDAHVTILTAAKLADFWERVEAADEVISISPGENPFSVAGRISGKFDAAILFPNSIRSALEVFLAGIPRRAGYAGTRRGLLLNEIAPAAAKQRKKKSLPEPAEHQVFHYLRLAEYLGAKAMPDLPPWGSKDQTPDLKSPSRVREAAEARVLREFFAGAGSAHGDGPVKIGICAGAEYGPAKRWPAERFAAAAKLVSEGRECEWVLYGTAADESIATEIAAALEGGCTNLAGKTSLAELVDSLAGCSALVTNDTGTMHLAAFLRVPTVAIFGSTEPALTGPLGPRHRVIRHHVECSPCFLRECPIDFRCMKGVEPEMVAAAVKELLFKI